MGVAARLPIAVATAKEANYRFFALLEPCCHAFLESPLGVASARATGDGWELS